ncbi:DUF6861 domain-containing protein [Methylobacter marinus]|uniref:DUF6861 domain-containing protein n=1 Tax=Methylobacter marinus TaxID=34058 RepID=UPI0003A4AB3D|nr:hypothetical protein [Methylobacter marinus]
MPNDPYKNPFESWHRQRCHPNAPAGGGGPGNFTSAGPLGSGDQCRDSLPHPNSPAGRYLTHQEIRTPALHERVEYVVKAYFLALRLAPGTVYQETGYQLGQVIEALLPGLLQMLAVLGISVVAGAAVGAAIGLFLGGVSAAPGAVVGAELGLEIGTAVLAWMGLGFLAVAIGQGMGELTGVLTHAIRRAWYAADHHHPQFETDQAAEGLAQAVGILFRLILQGLLAYVLKKGAVSSSQAALSTAQTLSRGGTGAAADATLAEVSALLRKSKLPDGFVVWLERNWDDLKRNPKLVSNKTGPNSSSQSSSSAATPSELKGMRERQGREDVGKNPGNGNRPVAERTINEKAAFGERSANDRVTGKDGSSIPNSQLTNLSLSERHILGRLSIPKKTGNTLFLGSRQEALADLSEIQTGNAIREGELFTTSAGRVWGRHNSSIHPVSGPNVVDVTSSEYNILVQAQKQGADKAMQTLEHMTNKQILNSEQYQRTREIVNIIRKLKNE